MKKSSKQVSREQGALILQNTLHPETGAGKVKQMIVIGEKNGV
jgi:hypothetical protein